MIFNIHLHAIILNQKEKRVSIPGQLCYKTCPHSYFTSGLHLCATCYRVRFPDYLAPSVLAVSSAKLGTTLAMNTANQSPDTIDQYPSHKILYLVRHAQGTHNVASQKDHDALLSDEYLDAPLSPLGLEQVINLREQIRLSGLFSRIDLVITSPLLRAIQTAVGVFGNEGDFDGLDVNQAGKVHTEKNGHHDQSNLNCPPIVAFELCRERLGLHPCDKRRNINEHKPRFPSVDFSLIESDEDILWRPDVRETDEEIAARGLKFLNWLWTRPEKKIAVVAHHRFLEHTLKSLEYGNQPLLKTKMVKEFHNCELRSLAIAENMVVTNLLDEDSQTSEDAEGKCNFISSH